MATPIRMPLELREKLVITQKMRDSVVSHKEYQRRLAIGIKNLDNANKEKRRREQTDPEIMQRNIGRSCERR
jgi:uncharacterized protein YlxW (UPF0749 family)